MARRTEPYPDEAGLQRKGAGNGFSTRIAVLWIMRLLYTNLIS